MDSESGQDISAAASETRDGAGSTVDALRELPVGSCLEGRYRTTAAPTEIGACLVIAAVDLRVDEQPVVVVVGAPTEPTPHRAPRIDRFIAAGLECEVHAATGHDPLAPDMPLLSPEQWSALIVSFAEAIVAAEASHCVVAHEALARVRVDGQRATPSVVAVAAGSDAPPAEGGALAVEQWKWLAAFAARRLYGAGTEQLATLPLPDEVREWLLPAAADNTPTTPSTIAGTLHVTAHSAVAPMAPSALPAPTSSRASTLRLAIQLAVIALAVVLLAIFLSPLLQTPRSAFEYEDIHTGPGVHEEQPQP